MDAVQLGVTYYIANCVIGLLCSFMAFFLVEAPALNLKALLLPKVFSFMGTITRTLRISRQRTRSPLRPVEELNSSRELEVPIQSQASGPLK